ncbi:MAG: ribulose-phosphate 3-epimerase, partial [Clostridia bacterium]|nr:ribulose-phosphate 3-epimerase [Clostridia bacterium]
TLDKVKLLKKIKEEKGYNYLVEIDGGVCKETIKDVLDAGAEVVVAGSAVFGAKDWKEAMDALRKA